MCKRGAGYVRFPIWDKPRPDVAQVYVLSHSLRGGKRVVRLRVLLHEAEGNLALEHVERLLPAELVPYGVECS